MTNLDKEKFQLENNVDFDQIDSALFEKAKLTKNASETISSKPYSYWKSVFKILFSSKTFVISIIVILIVLALSFIVPIVNNYENGVSNSTQPASPSWDHLFGVGMKGEDFFTRIWAGTQTTLLFALLLAVIQIILGVFIGLIWGYFRKSDIFFIQLTNIITIIPQFILLLLMMFLLGDKPWWKENVYWIIVLGVVIQAWVAISSSIRVQVVLVKNTDYNTASVSLGSSSQKIIRKNIIPKILPVIVQTGAFAIPSAISIEASLSYLSFNFIPAKKTSLGQILNEVMNETKWQIYPNLIIAPIAVIMIIAIAFFLVARVFADSLDPKNHR